jgi:uncharacterized protein (TIGR03067 family)
MSKLSIKTLFCCVLFIGFFFFGVCLNQASITSELEGTWKDTHQGWSFEFSGNDIKITAPSPQMCIEGTFTLDPSADPKEIDIKINKAGSPQFQGLTSLGIYKIEDIVLTLVLAEPGNNTRPQTFSSGGGAMVFVLTKTE